MSKKAKRTHNIDDWRIAVYHRNRAKVLVKQEKRKYYLDLLEEHKTDSKKYWQTINSLFKPKNQENNFILVDQISKEKIAPENTANFINDYFVGIGPKLAENYNSPWIPPPTQLPQQFELQPITLDQLEKIILALNPSKSSAVNNIKSSVLKDAFMILSTQLLHIINCSINQNLIPDKWKIATVIPLQKDGNTQDVNNLRPISTLPLPGKILERIIHNQTSTYLAENNILTEHQSGFRQNHSTIQAIADFTDDTYKAINNNNITHTVFIDFSKAFDTINHSILISKLKFLGFSDNASNWFKNYITGRKQHIIANNTFSQTRDIICGVPQGSILGPLLFLLYINDVENCLQYTKYKLYADDTVLYICRK